jgi:methionyl-tRNA formyltransferase
MEEGLDTGDILEKEEVILSEDGNRGSLHDKLSQLGGRLIVSTLEKNSK